MGNSSHHFVAIFGGAVAGSEAAFQMANRGFRVVVFDQNTLPYGKIEDGLPKWHDKLRDKEEGKSMRSYPIQTYNLSQMQNSEKILILKILLSIGGFQQYC